LDRITIPKGARNLAFGLFYLDYGGGWLVGSVTIGLLYKRSRVALVCFAVTVQLASLPFFIGAARRAHSGHGERPTQGRD
jgi:hypothetical protein